MPFVTTEMRVKIQYINGLRTDSLFPCAAISLIIKFIFSF